MHKTNVLPHCGMGEGGGGGGGVLNGHSMSCGAFGDVFLNFVACCVIGVARHLPNAGDPLYRQTVKYLASDMSRRSLVRLLGCVERVSFLVYVSHSHSIQKKLRNEVWNVVSHSRTL